MVQADEKETQQLLPLVGSGWRPKHRRLNSVKQGQLKVRHSHTYGAVPGSETTNEAARLNSGVVVTWSDVSVSVPKNRSLLSSPVRWTPKECRQVLSSVFGVALPGCLTAVMGSSGSGKSTLMTALAARCPGGVKLNGKICYNGIPIHRSMLAMSGFVFQDDIFVGSLTVREHLTFVAHMKLGRLMCAEKIARRVNDVLDIVGLTKSQHTRIGNHATKKSLSGGEKKRLAFASEVLADPPVLFCDEPTTGLDSHTAEGIVATMKQMASEGKTVVCTVHQPNSSLFSMFDNLLLLAQGRVAYMGETRRALDFFSGLNYECPVSYNPADFYIRCLAVVPGDEMKSHNQIAGICDEYLISEHARSISNTIELYGGLNSERKQKQKKWMEMKLLKRERLNWPSRFFWLTWRALLDSVRNPAVHWVRIVQKILMALVAGLCFSHLHVDQSGIQSIQGLLFILVTENTFPALYGVLSLFPKELPLFLREQKAGLYSTSEYYISRVVSLVPGFIVDPLLFVGIIYLFVPFPRDGLSVVTMLTVAIATCNTAASCGCLFSAAFENVPMAVALLIPFDYLLMITGGIFLRLSSLPSWLSWTKYLSWFKYANEAFSIVQWQGVTDIPCFDITHDNSSSQTFNNNNNNRSNSNSNRCLSSGEQILQQYTFSSDDMSFDFTGLAALFLAFHLVGMLALWRRSRHS